MPAITSYPKANINVLLLENISDKATTIFKENGYSAIHQQAGALTEDELIEALRHTHILGIRSKTKITEKVMRAAPHLQAIGCFCIGVNQVDLEAANRLGIAVFNAPYSNTRSVAELVIGLSIMLLRKIGDKNTAVHRGIWQKEAHGCHELRNKNMGIVGYGNIGTQVGLLSEALGMQVRYYDIEKKLPLGNAYACNSLEQLLKHSDIVSLHIPATPHTAALIQKSTLQQMKKGAVLINCARGEVVNITDLVTALQEQHLAGAAVDVYPWEPEKNNHPFETPLQNIPNVILTPHIGGSTEEAQLQIGEDVSLKLFQFLESGVTQGSHSIPSLQLPPILGAHRILHIHQNVPGVLGAINTALAELGVNIIGQYLKTNEAVGYVVLDVDAHLSTAAIQSLKQIPQTIKVRLLY